MSQLKENVVDLFKNSEKHVNQQDLQDMQNMFTQLKQLLSNLQYNNFKLLEENLRLKLARLDNDMIVKYKGNDETAFIDLQSGKILTGTFVEIENYKREFQGIANGNN